MERKTYYAPVSVALEELRKKGYTVDFNLKENCLVCGNDELSVDDFEITEIYRYEGNTDPADEAMVYAIESNTGMKGVLVTGYGITTDTMSAAMLKKLS